MTHPSLELIDVAASALAGLPVVFVGGATLGLYIPAKHARSTDDVDCVVPIATRMEYARLEIELRRRGFFQSVSIPGPICRWYLNNGVNDDIIVDVMPTDANTLGFSNRWYELGVSNAIEATLPSGRAVRIFPPGLMVAAKIEAFHGRGEKAPQESTDLEDIVAMFDLCPGLEVDILGSPPEARLVS